MNSQDFVYMVTSGPEAMEFLFQMKQEKKSSELKLIIMDLNLPGMSGFEVLDQIRADSNYDGIPIIVYSCSSSKEDVLRCYQSQANSYIVKPGELHTYIDTIKALGQYWCKTVTTPERA